MKNKKITKEEEKLSKNEKNILTTMINHIHSEKTLILIDNIEDNLDFEIQKKIIPNLKEINPNSQMIISTKSPYVVGGILDDENVKIHSLDKSNTVLNEAKMIL